MCFIPVHSDVARAETTTLIGEGGDVYSYIDVLPDEFLIKSNLNSSVWKKIRRPEHEYLNVQLPPPPQLTF